MTLLLLRSTEVLTEVLSSHPRLHHLVTDRNDEEPEPYHPSGGMMSATSAKSMGISGPGLSGYMDLRPATGISGLAWLGVGACVLILMALIWQWLF